MSDWPESAGWPAWAFENHDAPRAVSRWSDEAHRDAFAHLKMLLLCALRGSIIIYQGEELGLPQVDVPFDKLQDPEAILNWPHTLSRDGARTPIPWTADAPNLGFSSGTPWLPVGDDHRELAVDRQEQDPGSPLACSRACLALRKSHPALRTGRLSLVEVGPQKLVFDRSDEHQKLRCSFNLSASPAPFQPSGKRLFGTGDCADGKLGTFAAVIEELE
jgi:alpha-glucosidase